LKVSGKQEAVHFDISPNTFDRLVSDGLMPKPVQIYGRKVWDRFTIDRAFEALQGLPASPQVGAWD
jgi:predicted DNA-binding transcriptional regulator AlpA